MKFVIGDKNYLLWLMWLWLLFVYFGILFDEIVVELCCDDMVVCICEYLLIGKVLCLVDDYGFVIWDLFVIVEMFVECYL